MTEKMTPLSGYTASIGIANGKPQQIMINKDTDSGATLLRVDGHIITALQPREVSTLIDMLKAVTRKPGTYDATE